MPIVPKSSTPERSLQTAGGGIPNSGGGLVGEGLQTLGRGIQSVTSDVLQVADRFALIRDEMEADNRIAEFRRFNTRLLSSPGVDDETGSVGLLNTFGAATINSSVRYQELTDKKAAELSKGLSPRALQAFRQSTMPVLLTGFQSIQTHESREASAASEKANVDVVKSLQEDAINNYTTPPEVLDDLLGEMTSRFIMADELNGLPTDPKALETFREIQKINIDEMKRTTVEARIATAIQNRNVASAEATMESHGHLLTDKSRQGLNNEISGFYANGATQNAVRWSVYKGGGDDRSIRQVQDQAISYALKEMNLVGRSMTLEQIDVLETAVETEYKTQISESKRLVDKASDDILGDLNRAIQSNSAGEGAGGYMTPQQVKTTYYETLGRLTTVGDEAGIAAAHDAFNAWRENPSMGGYAAVNDPNAQVEVDGMTEADLAKMTDSELNRKKPLLTKDRWETLNKARTKVLSGKPPVSETALSREEVQKRVATALNSKSLVPSLKTSAYSKEDAQLLASTVDLVFSYADKDSTPEGIQKAIAQAVFEKSEVQLGFFGGEYSISPAELMDSPNRVDKRILKVIQSRYGYTEDELEDMAVRRMALTEYFLDESKRRRRKQLNDGKFDE